MERTPRIVILLMTGIILLLTITSCSDDTSVCRELPYDKFQQGDIVFRRGDGIVSSVVLYNDVDGKYSHVGVVVRQGDSLMVVHAVPGEHDSADDFDRVKIESIKRFFNPELATRGAVMRMPLNENQQRLIGVYAVEKADAKVAFDHNYNLADTSTLYCTEFVQLIFGKVGIDLAQGRITPIVCPGMSGDYIMPSDVYRNENLTTIFNF